jgi:pimeloyl-ACP methyl ester carboxylesterase
MDGYVGSFASYDGTMLAGHERGAGPHLVCLPGGPGRSSAYLGDLGGLAYRRRLILLDNRGTGRSAEAAARFFTGVPAGMFPRGMSIVLPGAHYSGVTAPGAFAEAVGRFLGP